MIDRRTKNAEIFRDTEQRYSTDQFLREAVETSIQKQAFVSEESIIRIPALAKQGKRMYLLVGNVRLKLLKLTRNKVKKYAC